MATLEDKLKDFQRRRREVRARSAAAALGGVAVGAVAGPEAALGFMDRIMPQNTSDKPGKAGGLTDSEVLEAKLELLDKMKEIRELEQGDAEAQQEAEKRKFDMRLEVFKQMMEGEGKRMSATATVAAAKNSAIASVAGSTQDFSIAAMAQQMSVSKDTTEALANATKLVDEHIDLLSKSDQSMTSLNSNAQQMLSNMLSTMDPTGVYLLNMHMKNQASLYNLDEGAVLTSFGLDVANKVAAVESSQEVIDQAFKAAVEVYGDGIMKQAGDSMSSGVSGSDYAKLWAQANEMVDDPKLTVEAISKAQEALATGGDGVDAANPDLERLTSAFESLAAEDPDQQYNPTLRAVREDLFKAPEFIDYKKKTGIEDNRMALRQLAQDTRQKSQEAKKRSRVAQVEYQQSQQPEKLKPPPTPKTPAAPPTMTAPIPLPKKDSLGMKSLFKKKIAELRPVQEEGDQDM